jgi:hypothetical protein
LFGHVFDGWTAEQTINFKSYTYEQVLAFFSDYHVNAEGEVDGTQTTFSKNTFAGCAAKVFDKDGNQIVFDVATGAVINVVDAEGTVIYTTAAE